MTFRASNQLPQDGYETAKRLAISIKSYCSSKASQFANDTTADVIISVFQDLTRWREQLHSIRQIPGIVQYARDQEDDPSYNVAAEFNNMLTAIDSVIANVNATYPRDGSGYLLDRKISGSSYDFRTFTPAQLSTLAALLTVVTNSIS
jgi:hypothetical protein